jgi:NitT/TauT family transport system substrate-binding protein
MMNRRWYLAAIALLVALWIGPSPGQADERLRFSSTQAGWDNSVVPLGVQAGIFRKNGLDIDVSFTDGSSATLQAIIAGGVDVGVVSVPLFLGAVVKGAPIRMISANFTGSSDILWYARADSRLTGLKDVTKDTKLGYATPGSSNFILLSGLLKKYGVTGELVASGGASATLLQVMSRQIDVGYDGNGGLGVPEFQRGDVKVIALGSELTLMQAVTTRGLVVTADTLAKRRDTLTRFMQAWQETVDWMYRDAGALQRYAEMNHASLEDAKKVVDQMYPASALRIGKVTGIDTSVTQGLQFKRISRPPTAEEIAAAFDIVWQPGE